MNPVLRVAIGALLLSACADRGAPQRADTSRATTSAARPATLDTARRRVTRADAAPSPASAAARDSTTRRPPAAQPAVAPSPRVSAPRRVTLGDIDFTGIGHDRGDPRAPVVVIDLSDFGCPYCGTFSRETYPVIEREYVRTGKVYFKYVPFIAGSFPHAREATRAAECAADQGRFWEMFDRIYETQAEWRRGSAIDAQMAALAGTIPLDSARYAACYHDGRTEARTARATDLANQIGVRVTPSFLVDGRPVQGALPIADFRKVIDAALLLAGSRR